MIRRTALVLAAILAIGAAPPDWRALDPENMLVVDTTRGRIVVEMRPELAPLAVARVKLLTREGVYDGLQFHRVIDGFVDQTGNPNNKDGGASRHPDLAPEFSFLVAPADLAVVRSASDGQASFVGSIPVESVGANEAARSRDGRLRAWGAYCAGVAGMGRQADPGTANSEIFFMRAPSRRLDRGYTVWGRVVVGLDVVRQIAVGEPPERPDLMLKVRVGSDIPPGERPKPSVLNERGAAFAERVAKARAARGADFSVCDVEIEARLDP